MVNAAHVDRVIASIKGEISETHDLGFNMNGYVNPASAISTDNTGRKCEWVGCIGGHAYILATGHSFAEAQLKAEDVIEGVAMRYLGITCQDDARCLFFDLPDHMDLSDISPGQATAALERLKSGAVTWTEEPV